MFLYIHLNNIGFGSRFSVIYSSSCRYNLAAKVFPSYEKACYNNNDMSVDTDEVIIFYFKFDENGH